MILRVKKMMETASRARKNARALRAKTGASSNGNEREGIEMAETLHEMAVRMVKGEVCHRQYGKGCDKCPAGKLRSANGVCLVLSISKVDNCEEQIDGLRAWAAENPAQRYPNWREAWLSLFPYAEEMCPGKLFGEDCPEGMLCSECIERPMSKKVAEKLGIRPIEEV